MLRYIDGLFTAYESLNCRTSFGEIFDCISGFAFKSKEYLPTAEFKVVTIKNIGENGFEGENCDHIEYRKEFDVFALKIGDLLLTMTGNIGRVGVVDREKCLLNQRVLKIDTKAKGYALGYLRKHKRDLVDLGKGTAQKTCLLKRSEPFLFSTQKVKLKTLIFLMNFMTIYCG